MEPSPTFNYGWDIILEDELKEVIKILDLQDLKRARDFISEYLSK